MKNIAERTCTSARTEFLADVRSRRTTAAAAIPSIACLAFGKWGTYKRVELLMEAFEKLSAQMPNVRLIVAGGNHPATPGYIESIAERMKDNPRVEFTGYVEEDDIPRAVS